MTTKTPTKPRTEQAATTVLVYSRRLDATMIGDERVWGMRPVEETALQAMGWRKVDQLKRLKLLLEVPVAEIQAEDERELARRERILDQIEARRLKDLADEAHLEQERAQMAIDEMESILRFKTPAQIRQLRAYLADLTEEQIDALRFGPAVLEPVMGEDEDFD